MKIKIKRKIEKEEIIDIDFPYYYEHDLLIDEANVIIYGKIEENRHVSIKVSERYYDTFLDIEFEIGIENRRAETLSCYMTDEYKSTESVFLKAKSKLIKSLPTI